MGSLLFSNFGLTAICTRSCKSLKSQVLNIPIDSFIAVIISCFGILLCLTVGIQIVFRKKGILQANIFLGFLLVLNSLTLLNNVMAMTGLYSKYQFLYFLPLTFSFSIGPLFYLFVRSRIQPGFVFSKKDTIHFVLPALQFLFYLSIGFRSAEFKSWIWRNELAPYGQFIEESVLIILSMGYVFAATKLVSKELPIELWKHPICKWLKNFSVSLLILLAISSLYEITDWALWGFFEYNLFNTPWVDFPLKITYGIISLLIGYNAFIYQHQSLVTPTFYSNENGNNLKERIQELLEQKQVYLDPELNIDAFSKMLGLHRNQLSKYFTSQGSSFRTTINEYRVWHFLELVKAGKNQHLTILGLAFESGFNSKASFNRIFKASQGQTPRDYIQAK